MAINRSDVANIVQQAASRMNLSLETEQEIMESLESEYINDVWQLHHITLEHWKSMGAPIGFLASLEVCLEEAGFSKDGKTKTKTRKSSKIDKGWKSVGMTNDTSARSSGDSKVASGRSARRLRNASRSSSRDSDDVAKPSSGRSATRPRNASRSTSRDNAMEDSTKVTPASKSRQTALKELKDRLRAETKQGLAQVEFDTKGGKIYEWDQNDSCVLVYVTWPFEFEFGPSTKFKCTISKDTLLLKAKHKSGQRSLRYTTGGLVNTLHSEWCVVSKGKAANGVGQAFAIEVALFKKNAGIEWSTALIAKHIGTSNMSPEQIREELKGYGLDPGDKSHDELLQALRQARSKGNSNFSALGPNRPKAIGRSHSADDVQLYDGPKSPGSLSSRSPGSLASSKKSARPRRTRSTSTDRPLVADTNVNKFSEGQIVYYTSSDGSQERAKILKIHLDDELVPFYDIRLTETGKEKQTTDSHLSRLTDDLFAAGDTSNSSDPSESAHSRTEAKSQPSKASTAAASTPVPSKSRFTENQVVYYTNNGEKQKAKILKIHLDDELVPFYDIKLVDSGNEKQTTDARLSSLTDDLFKAAAMGQSVVPAPAGPPERKAPGRSRSMGSADVSGLAAGSLGPLKKGRRNGRRGSTTMSTAAPPMARAVSDGAQSLDDVDGESAEKRPATNAAPPKSRFMESQVVYYTNNDKKEKAKILKIHLDDDLVPFYDIRLLDSGNEKQTTDSRLSSLTDDLFKAAAQGQSVVPGPPERKAPGRSRSMGSTGVSGLAAAVGSPGPLKKGRRNDRRQPPPTIPSPLPSARGVSDDTLQKSRFTENQVVYYTNNGQKEKAKILKIHLDDDLVPFYDIRLLDSGNEKQTTDSRLSSLTDDLFKAAAQGQSAGSGPGPSSKAASQSQLRRGSVGPGVPAPPERRAPGRSRSMGASGMAAGGTVSPGPLKKGRRNPNRNSTTQNQATGNIANIKKELGGYGGMSPSTYKYANDGEMIAAWRFIQEDSKLSVGRLKKELRELGQSTEYIEKKEMIGALCKARLEQKRAGAEKTGGSDRDARASSGEPGRYKVQRRNSDGPLSMLKKGKRRAARGK